MNVVIFGKGFGRPRQLNLSGRSMAVLAVLVAGALCSTAFVGGYWYSAQTGSGVSMTEVRNLTGELASQREAITTTRQQTEDTLDALAIRIGQMNARIIRLDALGRRLTGMAGLKDGEFDFDSDPAFGGPEEPYATGSAIAVPEVLAAMEGLDSQLGDREVQLGVLESVLMNKNLSDRVYPKGRPVMSGWMSSYFGRRTDPFTGLQRHHGGIDIVARRGTPVTAPAEGIVTYAGLDPTARSPADGLLAGSGCEVLFS